MIETDQKSGLFSFSVTVFEKFHLNAAHTDLHKWIYVLCVPSAVAALNASAFYLKYGAVATWPTTEGAAWAADTYAAPWIALLACVMSTVLFVIFVRHKRVCSSTKIATSAMLSVAWLFTLISFLFVE